MIMFCDDDDDDEDDDEYDVKIVEAPQEEPVGRALVLSKPNLMADLGKKKSSVSRYFCDA